MAKDPSTPKVRKSRVPAPTGRLENVPLDAIDEALIAELRVSARAGQRELGKLLGVNEATIRSRLHRLESENVLRIVAMQDLSAMSYDAMAAVGVQVKGRSAVAVGEDLALIDNIITVNVTVGAYDLEIQVIARDTTELDRLLTDVIARVDGVERLFPSLSLRILKYNPEWAPL